MKIGSTFRAAALIGVAAFTLTGASPLVLKEQGSFFVGGESKTLNTKGGGEITINQMYVQ